MTPFKTLAGFAARQHHVVCTDDLRRLGFSEERVRWFVHTERLFRLHPGVFAVGRPDSTREGRWLAAVLACSDPAALSHLSAAVFRQLLEYEGARPEVVVPASASHKGPTGIHVHRSSDITEEDIEVVDSIRVTTVRRTLVDLSRSRLSTRSLDAAVRQASRVHKLDLRPLRGIRRLDAIVRLYDPLIALTESDFEAVFLALCVKYGLPLPRPQRRTGRRRVDFLFVDARLVIECDSRSWHDNDAAFLDDRRKDRELYGRGLQPLRFTWAEVVYEPAKVAAEIKAALLRRRRELRGS